MYKKRCKPRSTASARSSRGGKRRERAELARADQSQEWSAFLPALVDRAVGVPALPAGRRTVLLAVRLFGAALAGVHRLRQLPRAFARSAFLEEPEEHRVLRARLGLARSFGFAQPGALAQFQGQGARSLSNHLLLALADASG